MARLAGIQEGDIVECDVKGRRFYALVTLYDGIAGTVEVRPITHNISYRLVSSRQVRDVWRKRRPRAT